VQSANAPQQPPFTQTSQKSQIPSGIPDRLSGAPLDSIGSSIAPPTPANLPQRIMAQQQIPSHQTSQQPSQQSPQKSEFKTTNEDNLPIMMGSIAIVGIFTTALLMFRN
jgi:hypothetical protein